MGISIGLVGENAQEKTRGIECRLARSNGRVPIVGHADAPVIPRDIDHLKDKAYFLLLIFVPTL